MVWTSWSSHEWRGNIVRRPRSAQRARNSCWPMNLFEASWLWHISSRIRICIASILGNIKSESRDIIVVKLLSALVADRNEGLVLNVVWCAVDAFGGSQHVQSNQVPGCCTVPQTICTVPRSDANVCLVT